MLFLHLLLRIFFSHASAGELEKHVIKRRSGKFYSFYNNIFLMEHLHYGRQILISALNM